MNFLRVSSSEARYLLNWSAALPPPKCNSCELCQSSQQHTLSWGWMAQDQSLFYPPCHDLQVLHKTFCRITHSTTSRSFSTLQNDLSRSGLAGKWLPSTRTGFHIATPLHWIVTAHDVASRSCPHLGILKQDKAKRPHWYFKRNYKRALVFQDKATHLASSKDSPNHVSHPSSDCPATKPSTSVLPWRQLAMVVLPAKPFCAWQFLPAWCVARYCESSWNA